MSPGRSLETVDAPPARCEARAWTVIDDPPHVRHAAAAARAWSGEVRTIERQDERQSGGQRARDG